MPQHYSAVVVGAGTAGCVLASRLSEDENRTVLLIETGEAVPDTTTRTPGTSFFALSPERLYANTTTPQSGLGGRLSAVPSGKGLGGSGSVNLLAWFEGHPEDYAGWEANGATGWGWPDVEPVFARMRQQPRNPGGSDPGVGIHTEQPKDIEAALLAFIAAGASAGMAITEDFNGDQRTGAGVVTANTRNGVRSGPVEGYLDPARERPNLHVRQGVQVQRVNIERGQARSVSLSDGTIVTADQIVLCAGALRSPQILLLSGIGDAEEFQQHGIELVHQLPGVGRNFQDHPLLLMVWSVLKGTTLLDSDTSANRVLYEKLHRGPLAAFPTVGMVIPDDTTGLAGEWQLLPYLLGVDETLQPLPTPAMTVTMGLLTPKSRGRVSLESSDPLAPPRINPNYLQDERDLERLIKGVNLVERLMNSPEMHGFLGGRIHPTATEDLRTWILRTTGTQWHPAGTCRIGTDKQAVVDPTLRVHGIQNLFVADASVMPTLTRGNLQAPVVMIAERAAAFISSQFHARNAR